jgi:hypothetical protein
MNSYDNGYDEEGFDEWVESQRGKRPQIVDIIRMEKELGIPKIDSIKNVDDDKVWAYYHELKARMEQQQRKTA